MKNPEELFGVEPQMPVALESVGITDQEQQKYPQEEGIFSNVREMYGTKCIRGVARIAGAEIKYTYELPDSYTDEVPLVLVPGYGGVKSAYHWQRKTLAASGKPAISYRPPRSQSHGAGFLPSHWLQPSKLQSQAVWAVMRDIRDTVGTDVFDLSGHSMGGQTSANVAMHKPEHIRSVLFVASAGMDGHGVREMRDRAKVFIREELLPALPKLAKENHPKIALDALHYIFRNFPRTLREGISVGNCDVREKISRLGELGIKTAALQFQADSFFPLQGVLEGIDKYSPDPLKVDLYPDPEAGHLTPQLEPVSVARASLNILKKLHAPEQVVPLKASS